MCAEKKDRTERIQEAFAIPRNQRGKYTTVDV